LMSEFEEELFGESTKSLDRMMLSQEANKRLDAVLDRCIRRLGQWMGLKSGAKCFEWLVRRFRVHEMNVGAVIQAFLPYHESTQFPRILAILQLDPKSPYYNLLHPLQKTPQTLDRALIVRYMSPAKDSSLFVLQDIMNLLAQAEQERAVHRALVNFWGAVMLDFVERMRLEKNGIPEPVVKILVEGFIKVLSCQHGGADFAVSSYEEWISLLLTLPISPPSTHLCCCLSDLCHSQQGHSPCFCMRCLSTETSMSHTGSSRS
jgi:U3 small nucleolar RNA-associated protein 10